MPELNHVKGKDRGKIILYALSTCIWCKKARKFLDDLGIDYYYIYVDTLEKGESENVKNEMRKISNECSFPTIVFKDNKCVVGYNEDKIKKELGNE